MPLLQWEPRYSVGIAAMDAQHHRLIDLINTLHEAMVNGDANNVLGTILHELVLYTKTHFAAEERLMRDAGYPGLEAHQRLHAMLVDRVATLMLQHNNGAAALSISTSKFLKDWLVIHIQDQDQAYGKAIVEAA